MKRLVIGMALLAATAAAGAWPAQDTARTSPVADTRPSDAAVPSIAFGPGSAMMSTAVRQQLDAIAMQMRDRPGLRLQVRGFAAREEADAPALAVRRAELVRRWIGSTGIAAARFDIQPAEVGDGASARRVELRLLPPGG